MTTRDLSAYAQGKIVGENWTPDEPPPVCPFEAGTQEAVDFQQGVLEVKVMQYQIWPCQSVGKPGNYTVAQPGGQPVFVAGAYHWPKQEAEAIRDRFNREKGNEPVA